MAHEVCRFANFFNIFTLTDLNHYYLARQLAISGFREFLRRFPDSVLAADAQYWIGEVHFSLARTYATQRMRDKARQALAKAALEFRTAFEKYPWAGKAPTALYKEALALVDLELQGEARVRLEYLVDHFSESDEAPMARELLKISSARRES